MAAPKSLACTAATKWTLFRYVQGEPASEAFPKLRQRLTAAGCAHLYPGLVQKAIAQILKVGRLLLLALLPTLRKCGVALCVHHCAVLFLLQFETRRCDALPVLLIAVVWASARQAESLHCCPTPNAMLQFREECAGQVQGYAVLHSCGFCSMDCKSDNILASMGPLGEDLHCTVTDLGSALRATAGQSFSTKVTIYYPLFGWAATELWRGHLQAIFQTSH